MNPALARTAARYRLVVTIEDGTRVGGVAACHDAGVRIPVVNLELPTAFVPSGSRATLLAEAGPDVRGITRAVHAALDRMVPAQRARSVR